MMKRGYAFALVFLAVFVNMGFVSAASIAGIDVGNSIRVALESIEETFRPFLEVTIGGYDTSEFFWMKFLLLILMFVVMKAAIKATPKLGENNAVVNIVALVISLFAVRYISQNQLTEGILLPYGVLGVALTTILPFLIFFFFVEKTSKGPGARKAMWFAFILIMFLVWFTKSDELNAISNWIYWGIMVLSVLLFFFDKHVQLYFGRRVNNERRIDYLKNFINSKAYNYRMALENNDKEQAKKIAKQIDDAEKEIHKLS